MKEEAKTVNKVKCKVELPKLFINNYKQLFINS